MIKVSVGTGRVIAGESAAVFEAADTALLNSARLAVSILEASSQARLDPKTKQKLLEAMSEGQSRLVSSRKSFTTLHTQLRLLQRKTNLAEVSWGCGELSDVLKKQPGVARSS